MSRIHIVLLMLLLQTMLAVAVPVWKRTSTSTTKRSTKASTTKTFTTGIPPLTLASTTGIPPLTLVSTSKSNQSSTKSTKSTGRTTSTTRSTTTSRATSKATSKTISQVMPTLPPATGKSNLAKILSAGEFAALFPNADNSVPASQRGYFTYSNLIKAADYFPQLFSSSNTTIAKREIAAFLAQTAHETTGGWAQAPGGAQAWGYVFNSEVGCEKPGQVSPCTQYTACTSTYPCSVHTSSGLSNFQYFGRGPIQLSWNYNYAQASQAIFGDKMVLINNPMAVSQDGAIGFVTALWFWATPQYNKPSSHSVMQDHLTTYEATGVIPPACGNRIPGLGLVTNIINGGLECGSGIDVTPSKDRMAFYTKFTGLLGVNAGPSKTLSCATQRSF